MNKITKLLTTTLMTCATVFSVNAYANADQAKAKAEFEAMAKQYNTAIENAAKSSDIRGGLVKACGIQYKKVVDLKLLTQADANKLCGCTVDAEGQITTAQKWELQSASNAKNQAKLQQLQAALMKKQGDSVKKCVGSALDQKLSKLAQQAQAPK